MAPQDITVQPSINSSAHDVTQAACDLSSWSSADMPASCAYPIEHGSSRHRCPCGPPLLARSRTYGGEEHRCVVDGEGFRLKGTLGRWRCNAHYSRCLWLYVAHPSLASGRAQCAVGDARCARGQLGLLPSMHEHCD